LPGKPSLKVELLIRCDWERYVLFTQPYPLLDVDATEWDNAAIELDGLKRPGELQITLRCLPV